MVWTSGCARSPVHANILIMVGTFLVVLVHCNNGGKSCNFLAYQIQWTMEEYMLNINMH